MGCFPLTNSIIFQDGYCTNQIQPVIYNNIWKILGEHGDKLGVWPNRIVFFFYGKPNVKNRGTWGVKQKNRSGLVGWYNLWYTLWLFNIAMENGPFIDSLPIKNDDLPWLC